MGDVSQLKEDINNKANTSDVYTKTETDNKIISKVAEIVAGAPEEFDTLKEMSDWLIEHEDSAAAMNLEIQTLKTEKANAADVYTKTEIDDKVSTINTSISNLDDLKLSKSDSITLTQTEYEELAAAGELTALEYNIIEE